MAREVNRAITEVRDQLRKIKKRWKVLWLLSLIAFAMVLFSLIFQPENFNLWTLGGFFIMSVPFSFYIYVEHSRLASIEEHFPDFLRDIAEFKRSGVTLAKAIQNASSNDYGNLSPEVKKIALELSWGVSFEEAMQLLLGRVESPMIDRAISIITAAQSAGGEVTTILETVSADLRKLKELEAERKSKLSVYTMTIYAIYLLLLFIIIVLTESLVPAIPKMQAAGEFLGGSVGSISEFEFRELLFQVTVLEALFAGLISGQMGEGKVTAGIKHSIILVIITLLAFQLVPPATIAEKIGETILDIPPASGVTTRSIEGVGELTESFDSNDVATEVKALAKERNRNQYKAFSGSQIEFISFGCTPCTSGELTIESGEVTVLQPTMIRYSVKYAGDRYQVAFSDANI
ncbi:type II secretion system F family protein [archaeon]